MKFFALNLCLSFEVETEALLIPTLMLNEEQARAAIRNPAMIEASVLVVRVTDPRQVATLAFALQADAHWRESGQTWRWLFPDAGGREIFRQHFLAQFALVLAAGGLVLNERNEALLIFNRNRWSLPKGHVEDRENEQEAASREVTEETGLANLSVRQALSPTWHTYQTRKGKWILKKTCWFLMYADSEQPIAPQEEEHIEAVQWISRKQWEESHFPTYPLTRFFLERNWPG